MLRTLVKTWALAATAVAWLAPAQPAAAQAFGAPSSHDRGQRWEGSFGARLLMSDSADFAGGSTIDTEDDLGFVFGFGYHFNDRWLLSGEMSWNTVSYDGDLISADLPPANPVRINGELDTGSIGGMLTFHLLEGPLTPYASASLGWTWVDTNIATGPPDIGCWWDPFWGQICTPIYDTVSDDSASYGLGLGVRWDFGPGAFARFGYEERWLDIKNADGTPSFGSFRLDIGSKF
jgi:opacity protein-like surface antigen